ncbi:uncharacterized protein [Spinacia oleracea]|uniref:SWIM-type domain-containing protein n=1 Tax=Spinacia oleracea TaxID=3562 RepID=A0A9R0JEU6_SPIOL|nr:uncharacterized protein LOC110805457 [Spinacia oleracea]
MKTTGSGPKDKGKGIMPTNRQGGSQIRNEQLGYIDLAIWMGGKFVFNKGETDYVGGKLYTRLTVWLHELTVFSLRELVMKGMSGTIGRIIENFSVWFRLHGMNLTKGRKIIHTHDDIWRLLETKDGSNRVILYIIEESKPAFIGPSVTYQTANFKPPRPLKQATQSNPSGPQRTLTQPITTKPAGPSTVTLKQVKMEPLQSKFSLVRRSPRLGFDPDVIYMGKGTGPSENPSTVKEPNKTQLKKPIASATVKASVPKPIPSNISSVDPHTPSTEPTEIPPHTTTTPTKPSKTPLPANPPLLSPDLKTSTPRRKSVAQKGKKVKGKAGKVGKKKGKGKKKDPGDCLFENDEFGDWSESDSDFSDLDVEFEPGEEDRKQLEEDELFCEPLSTVLRGNKRVDKVAAPEVEEQADLAPEVEEQVDLEHEVDYDSEELRSLCGSDDEVDPYPTFNPESDFKKKIVLSLGLKFPSVHAVRKAIRYHSIENHYDYYLLHNGRKRVSVYCRYRCSCPWDKKHAKLVKCVCDDPHKCRFKIHVKKLRMEETFQIKSLRLKHTCGVVHSSSKITSEWLAEKYLEEWRSEPYWRLVKFRERVYKETGLHIGYYKSWFARARAKLILYGDAADEYAAVYDYGYAILQYNPGSSAYVQCQIRDNPTPFFQRLYVCFEALKVGFKNGCRPLIGVDGCHLKGAHPGMILVAVSKDGNNNIFPVAWAVVEVENADSWTWFLDLLMKDIGHHDGEGLTLMSDRQKGLLDAISVVSSKAEVRFCARHIWANFKNKFSGTAYKDLFWAAARSTTKHWHDSYMAEIKELNEDAYNYLSDIPPVHWCRHAFGSNSRSNMLLNNLCETFNAVIREARDKPIITCLDWIRRYVMRRNAEKWEGIQKYEGRFMPFVEKVLAWVYEASLNCIVCPSRLDEWEVETAFDRHVVDLKELTCTCFRWELTGIPCPHAYACIVKKRWRPEDFVHECYSKAKYLATYSPHIKPMPGMKQWKKTDLPRPLPPLLRKMPGRPKSHKRKKEAGEDAEERFVKRGKKPNNCSNCKQPGHNKRKCNNPPGVIQPKEPGRDPSKNPWVVADRNKRAARVLRRYNAESVTQPQQQNSSAATMQQTFNAPPQSSQTGSYQPPPLSQTSSQQPGQTASQHPGPSSQTSTHQPQTSLPPKLRPKLQTTKKPVWHI